MACLWEAWFEAGDTDIVVLDSIDGEVLRLPKGLPATKKLVEEMLEYPIALRDRWIVRKFTKETYYHGSQSSRLLHDYLKRSKEKFELLYKNQTPRWVEGLKK